MLSKHSLSWCDVGVYGDVWYRWQQRSRTTKGTTFPSSPAIWRSFTTLIRGVITPNQIPLTTIVTYLQNKLQKQNFKPLGHYTCMQCGTSHLQKVQENILSLIILATYRKFTVATVRFTQNVTGNIFTHPIYQQVANVTV